MVGYVTTVNGNVHIVHVHQARGQKVTLVKRLTEHQKDVFSQPYSVGQVPVQQAELTFLKMHAFSILY